MLVGWLVGWLVGSLVSQLVGELVGWLAGWLVAWVAHVWAVHLFGRAANLSSMGWPHPVMDGPGTCNPRAVSLSWEHTHQNKTQAQQHSNTDFPNTTDKRPNHNKTKQNQTNTTKQDEANQTTKPNQVF